MVVIIISTLDLLTELAIAVALIAIFIPVIFHFDNKFDKFKESLTETQIKLERLESKIDTLGPVISFIKEVGQNEALQTFKNKKGDKE